MTARELLGRLEALTGRVLASPGVWLWQGDES
jgi:hypothetical protein